MKDVNALDLDKLLNESLSEESLKSLIDLIAQTSWWVSPLVYQKIQTVYPKTRRKKGKEEKRGDIVNEIRLWDNQPANQSFWMALGKTNKEIKNYFVCHIYDGSVWDPDHFTNLANITAFPKSLQSLSEWEPIADVLKYHSYTLYQYTGPKNTAPSRPKYYPESWSHVDKPDEYQVKKIIDKLKDQSIRRPTCSGN